jgi:hypothetical protein
MRWTDLTAFREECMYIESMTLSGFRCFAAEAVVVPLDPRLTAVIGPNVGLDDEAWWSYKQDVSEATSCFFVAFSRAKQRVAFTYCPTRGARNLIAPLYGLLAKAGVKMLPMT